MKLLLPACLIGLCLAFANAYAIPVLNLGAQITQDKSGTVHGVKFSPQACGTLRCSGNLLELVHAIASAGLQTLRNRAAIRDEAHELFSERAQVPVGCHSRPEGCFSLTPWGNVPGAYVLRRCECPAK
ncbi:MAG: hypothetical protein ACKVQA_14220 [Burkholderiales bacterium]